MLQYCMSVMLYLSYESKRFERFDALLRECSHKYSKLKPNLTSVKRLELEFTEQLIAGIILLNEFRSFQRLVRRHSNSVEKCHVSQCHLKQIHPTEVKRLEHFSSVRKDAVQDRRTMSIVTVIYRSWTRLMALLCQS